VFPGTQVVLGEHVWGPPTTQRMPHLVAVHRLHRPRAALLTPALRVLRVLRVCVCVCVCVCRLVGPAAGGCMHTRDPWPDT
jgi:hypothetical protein